MIKDDRIGKRLFDPQTPRERVISRMLGHISSLEQLNEISAEVHEWLVKHPDDDEIIANCESLAMLRGCFNKR